LRCDTGAVDRGVINRDTDRGCEVVRNEILDVGTRLINQLATDNRAPLDPFRDNLKRI
jgi:hypothetical protein